MIPYKRDGTANFEKGEKTEELTLDVENGGTMDNFFRVVVPLDIAGPVRFRIRRITCVPSYIFSVDEGGFILLDNIIASIPAMSADLVSAGHYDAEKTGTQTLGWELATSVPYPSIGDTTNIVAYAKPEFTLNAGDGSTPDTTKFFSSATMHYRWRYLNQTQLGSVWKGIDLNPADDFKSIGPLELPSRPGDVEYWFEYRLQAPYYKYVDYSGATNAEIDYTEERSVVTNRLAAFGLPSGGTDWFFRLREGKSDYAGVDIVFKRGEDAAVERVHMALVGNRLWRGFVQARSGVAGTMKYRIEAMDRQTGEFAEYMPSTNCWRCMNAHSTLPIRDFLEDCADDGWQTLVVDDAAGYVMLQVGEEDKSIVVTHAEYQDFNNWSDALARRDSQGRGPIFLSQSSDSPSRQTFSDDFSAWGDMSATNESWTFPTGLTDIQPSHMYGRTAYEPFWRDGDGFWEVGNGMWVAKKYRDDRNNAGVALQMEGNRKGYIQFTDAADAPRGIESISFNARLGQVVSFDDFSYYNGYGYLSLSNYTFMARTAFDLHANKDFAGNASLSVVANYLPSKGCYEARWEWLGNNATAQRGQRLCLYRWNVTSSGTKEPELIIARTNTVFHVEAVDSLANSSSQRFAPLFISVSNDVPNRCTYVVAGIRRCGVTLGTSPIGMSALNTQYGRNANWFGVCFKDTDQMKRLQNGTYGVLSANCPGVFACPEFSHTTQVTVGSFPANGKRSDSFENSSLSQVSNLQNIKNCAYDDLQDPENPAWNMASGRMKATYQSQVVNAITGYVNPQTLSIYFGTPGRTDWGNTPYSSVTVSGFVGGSYTIPIYLTKDCSVCIAVDGTENGTRTDVVADSVLLRQWRGGDWNGDDVQAEGIAPLWTTAGGSLSPVFTNFVFTSCWVTNHTVLMSAKRASLDAPCAIRSPLMDGFPDDGSSGDGYHRGIGLGMISVAYENAQENAVLALQIATNGVDYTTIGGYDKSFSDKVWTTVTNFNFAVMTPAQRKKGILNTYLGLRDVKGAMRLMVPTNTILAVKNMTDMSKFGDVTITSITCSDEPPVEVRSWRGWNIRTIGGDLDTEKRMFLNDYSTAAGGAGLSLAINNSVDENFSISRIDVSDRESYIQHKPFVQTPTFTSNVVGEVSFKARKYSAADPVATLVLFGSTDATEKDEGTWSRIDGATFSVSNGWYETYSYKTDPGQAYKAFRLAVVGIEGIHEAPGGGGNGGLPDGRDPERVLLDEMFVSEAIPDMEVDVPDVGSVVYTGGDRAPFGFGGCYEYVSGVTNATAVGEYSFVVRLKEGFAWRGGIVGDQTVTWRIVAEDGVRMGFRNVGCFRSALDGTAEVPDVPSASEQPLVGDEWGVQCEIYGVEMPELIDFAREPQVRLHWFPGGEPWGYDGWRDDEGHQFANLSRATDSSQGRYVYRSSRTTNPDSVIPMLEAPCCVQYMLEVVYYVAGLDKPVTNWLSSADWTPPEWYGDDLNDGDGGFACYCLLEERSPSLVKFTIVDGVLTAVELNGETEVVIPDGVTGIGDGVFEGLDGLVNVTIPGSVTNIGVGAFMGCGALQRVVFLGDAPACGLYAFYGCSSGCTAYVSPKSTGWGVSVGEKWNRLTLQHWPEVLTDAEDAEAIHAVLSGFADTRVEANISTVEGYCALAAWVDDKNLYQPAVKESRHLWPAYLLGAEALLENEPTIEIGEVTIVDAENGIKAMSVVVTVRDGGKTVAVDQEKVAAMFEATSDLGNWAGAALEPTVQSGDAFGDAMRFTVTPGDGSSPKAFLRIRK